MVRPECKCKARTNQSPAKERQYLSEKEVNQFVDAIEHKLIRLVAQTLYYTGMRISECLNLQVDDVDLKRT